MAVHIVPWEIWWVQLNDAAGYEQQGERPVLSYPIILKHI